MTVRLGILDKKTKPGQWTGLGGEQAQWGGLLFSAMAISSHG
jgi:hypothetical protein